MYRSLQLLAIVANMMLLCGCRHIHLGYGVPLYMQPKGFSMTYKEHLYSTPVGTGYWSRSSSADYREGQYGSGYSCEKCASPYYHSTAGNTRNNNAKRIESLMQGKQVEGKNHQPEVPQLLQNVRSNRIGQRDATPARAPRISSRF